MNEACKKELQEVDNMEEVFTIIQKYYDLSTAKLSFVTRLTVISGINTAIKITNPKEK